MWNHIWQTTQLVIVTAFVYIVVTLITADRTITFYYMQNSIEGSCIRANIEWEEDPWVMCDRDLSKVVALYDKLNQELKH